MGVGRYFDIQSNIESALGRRLLTHIILYSFGVQHSVSDTECWTEVDSEIERCRSARDSHELFGGIDDGKVDGSGRCNHQEFTSGF